LAHTSSNTESAVSLYERTCNRNKQTGHSQASAADIGLLLRDPPLDTAPPPTHHRRKEVFSQHPPPLPCFQTRAIPEITITQFELLHEQIDSPLSEVRTLQNTHAGAYDF
jgi:hypothetical protein